MEKQKKKIAFIEETAEMGGTEFNLLYFFQNIDISKIEPIVICPREGKMTAQMREIGVQVKIIKMPKFISTGFRVGDKIILNPFAYIINILIFLPVIFRLKLFFKTENTNLVHTNCLIAHIYGGLAGRMAGIPVVWHTQDIISPDLAFGMVRKMFILLAKKIPSKIVVISHAVGEMFSGFGQEKLILIYNAVDLSKYNNQRNQSIRRELGISDPAILVGMVGRLTVWKGHKDFIRAAEKVAGQKGNVKFIIVGDTVFEKQSYLDHLKKLVQDLDLAEQVIFTGFRSDIAEVMQSLDIFVLASNLPEPFGRVIIEAMAAGKPVVATNLGGVPEIVIDKVTGFLVPPSNPEKMAIKILELINDKEKRNLIGKAGRKRVEELFAIEKYVEKFTNLYMSLV